MNTQTNAYITKISSGTIAALLVFSGILFLVPFVATVHATNASPPVLSITTGSPIKGTIATALTFSVYNPSTNLYALTGLTITVPSGWAITLLSCVSGVFLKATGCSATTAQYAVGAGEGIDPGSTDAVTFTVTAPAPVSPITYPYVGTFTSTAQDASSLAFYAGPNVALSVIDPLTGLSFLLASAVEPTTPYIAGSAAETITVQQTPATTAEAGLVIDWTLSGASAGYGSYSLTSSSVTTVSGGVATASASFTPSDHAGDFTAVQAEVGSSGVEVSTIVVHTAPGSPSAASFLYTAGAIAFPASYYISGQNGPNNFNSPPHLGGATLAEIAGTQDLAVSVADKYGNLILFGTPGLTVSSITIQALSGGGGWDYAGDTALATEISCTLPAVTPGVNCGTGAASALNYFQGFTYATVGELEATISGTYPTAATPFVAPGSSGTIFTSTQATTLTLQPAAPIFIDAGAAVTVTGNLTASTQPGVPVTLGLCVSAGIDCGSAGYGGANSGFGKAGGPQIYGGSSVLGAHSATAGFGALYYVDTISGTSAKFNATASDPDLASSTNTIAWTVDANLVSTQPGAPSTLTIVFYYQNTLPGATADPLGVMTGCTAYTTPPCNPTTNIVAGQTVYPDATLADAYGNVVTVPASPTTSYEIQLSASAGNLADNIAFIKSGSADTYSSQGAIAYFTPSSAAVGTVLKVSASGVVEGDEVSGSATMTTVSATPTFSITSPSALVNNVIYTTSISTVFKGWANVSTGYDAGPTTVTQIVQIGYSVNGGHWQTATITNANSINFAIAAFFNVGLNTIQFNATDGTAAANRYISPKYQVLVDNTLPGITFSSTKTFTFGTTIPVTIFSDEGDLNVTSVTAFAGNTDLNVTAANFVGSNTLGANSTFLLNITNAPTGTYTLKVTASSYTGNEVTATETITVTVAFADSVQYVANSAAFTTEGAYSGVLASFTNAWSSSQSLIIFAKYTNSSGSWVYASSLSLNTDQTGPVFVAITVPQLSPGTYTLTLFAVTTSNLPVSVSTTIPGFTVT